jgi:hypothetical protein
MAAASRQASAAGGAASSGGGSTGGGGHVATAVWEVAGQRTEVLELQAAQPAPEVQLLIIPGNPGAASFYTPFMRSLHAQLRGRAAVCCVSNLGMVRHVGECLWLHV